MFPLTVVEPAVFPARGAAGCEECEGGYPDAHQDDVRSAADVVRTVLEPYCAPPRELLRNRECDFARADLDSSGWV